MNEGFDSPTRYYGPTAIENQASASAEKNSAKNSAAVSAKLYVKKAFAMATPYTPPTIFRGKKTWYINFEHQREDNPEISERIRITGDMNRIKDLVKREQHAQDLLKEVLRQLKAGKVPVKCQKPVLAPVYPMDTRPLYLQIQNS